MNTILLERVSPEVIFLRPPEKLVIEIKATGRYRRILWQKNGLVLPQEFPNHNEILVYGTTTQDDLGLYEVSLFPANPAFQRSVPNELDFSIVLPGMHVNLHCINLIFAGTIFSENWAKLIANFAKLMFKVALIIILLCPMFDCLLYQLVMVTMQLMQTPQSLMDQTFQLERESLSPSHVSQLVLQLHPSPGNLMISL